MKTISERLDEIYNSINETITTDIRGDVLALVEIVRELDAKIKSKQDRNEP